MFDKNSAALLYASKSVVFNNSALNVFWQRDRASLKVLSSLMKRYLSAEKRKKTSDLFLQIQIFLCDLSHYNNHKMHHLEQWLAELHTWWWFRSFRADSQSTPPELAPGQAGHLRFKGPTMNKISRRCSQFLSGMIQIYFFCSVIWPFPPSLSPSLPNCLKWPVTRIIFITWATMKQTEFLHWKTSVANYNRTTDRNHFRYSDPGLTNETWVYASTWMLEM